MMPDKDEKTLVAEWLVLGFKRAWLMRQVCGAAELPDYWTPDGAAALHARIPFLPANEHLYFKPARAYIAAEWPNLSRFLLAHERDPVKLLSVVPQIVRLTSASKASSPRSAADRKENGDATKELRRVEAANHAARRQQLSTQRGAWNVCK